MRLYDNLASGNGYKARLLLHQLGLAYERVELDTNAGQTRTADYLAINANGKIPVLRLDDGACLPESNAILFYLAEGTDFLPADRLARAQALQWMFFEQYSHEPCIAVSRSLKRYHPDNAETRARLAEIEPKGYAALDVMERQLSDREFFAGGRYSIADIALYAYTHVADEGGFSLDDYPNIRAWLARVAAQPGHIPIDRG